MERYYYDYSTFVKDVIKLAEKVKSYHPDTLLSIARGGLTLGHFLAVTLEMRRLFSINSVHYEDTEKLSTLKISNIPDLSDARRILVLDDIADSGETLTEVYRRLKKLHPGTDIRVATLFCKPSLSFSPDYCMREAKGWIDFFWDVDTVGNPRNL